MRLVCVTGMHRSGTSLVARMLNLLGVELGDEDELLGPAEDNPTGFWEHREVKALNDRVIAKLGGRWDDPPALPPGWENLPDLNPARKDAADFVADLPDAEVVGWKDPRLSLTLPFWRTVTAVDRTVLCLRGPEEVARSLAVRNGFPSEKSAELWIRYTLNAWLNDPDAIVLPYADALEDPAATASRLAEVLDLQVRDDALEEIIEFVDPGLHHHADQTLHGPSMRAASALHAVFANPERSDFAPLLSRLTAGWDASREVAALGERLENLLEERSDLEERQRSLQDAVERREEEIERQEELRRSALRERNAKIRSQALEIERLAARRDRLDLDVIDLRNELHQALSDRDELRERLHRAEVAARKFQAANEDLEGIRSSHRQLKQELRSRTRELERLRDRRIVRFGLAVASLFRPLFRIVRRVRKRSRRSVETEKRPETGTSEPADPADPADDAGEVDADATSRLVDDRVLASLRSLQPVTIVVPVFNAVPEFRRCFDALVRNTTRPAELLVIDDASTDPTLAPFLDEISAYSNVRILRNPRNLGFTATVNRGIDESQGDLVLLNSDTEVTPRWLENLTLAAYRDSDVATATAISDNAGAFSVPVPGEHNRTPPDLSADEIGRLVTRWSARIYPETPTGNGFCMYMKRAVLEEIGSFDTVAFPRGYGEENDLCMRAREAGYRNVVDDTTFVFHIREASFGEEKRALSLAGRAKLDERYPDYTDLVRAFVGSPEMRTVRQGVREAFTQASGTGDRIPRRILFVIHAGMGGAPQTNEDLVAALAPEHECFVLTSDTKRLVLYRFEDDTPSEIERLELDDPIELGQFTRPDYRAFVSDVLVRYGIEVMHVRHLIKHTFDAPLIARDLGIPVVLSFHDFYLSCPTVHLLDDQDRFCGGVCTPGEGRCRLPNDWLARAPEPLKHGWVHEWRGAIVPVLDAADVLVTTTRSAQEVYQRSYPDLRSKRFEIIEHGRDLDQRRIDAPAPTPGGTIRILVPGNLDIHKGGELIRSLTELDVDGRLEFHLLGRIEEEFRDLGVYHGTYARDRFCERAEQIAPAFVGLFSICAETYSHTLTEAWACGLPVIASELGALGERIQKTGRGWTIDVSDPRAAYERILALSDDPAEYWRVRSQVTSRDLPTVAEMAHEYDLLYRSVLRGHECFVPPDAAPTEGRILDMRLLVVGGGDPGTYPGSVHVRTLRRYLHPSIDREVAATVSDREGLLLDRWRGPDLVYVQRNAIPADEVDDVLAACRDRGLPLMVDLDDNLLEVDQLPADARQYRQAAPSLQRLVSAADLVSVSTQALAEAVSRWSDRVVVLPNHLDGTLWFGGRTPVSQDRSPVRIVYVGTKTHEEDLEILRPVITRLDRDPSVDVRLEVVGGEREGPAQAWYTRVKVPAGAAHYPDFVRWLKEQAPRWDVAVAPLSGTTFNHFKSDLKFLEYSALGLPGVYSAVGPYRSTVEHDRTGLLAENSVEAWTENLRRLCSDRSLRDRLANNAWTYVTQTRTLEERADELRHVLHLVASGRPLATIA